MLFENEVAVALSRVEPLVNKCVRLRRMLAMKASRRNANLDRQRNRAGALALTKLERAHPSLKLVLPVRVHGGELTPSPTATRAQRELHISQFCDQRRCG